MLLQYSDIPRSMFDHVGIRVADFTASKKFYEQVLATFGYKPLFGEEGVFFGFGAERPQFWISTPGSNQPSTKNVHIAFSCPNRATVDAFYTAAIAAGAKNNGGPGLRPEYHKDYYAAFVLDLDGNNIEAVCHTPDTTLTVQDTK